MARPPNNLLNERVSSNSGEIKALKQSMKPKEPRPSAKIGVWPIRVYKPLVSPNIKSKVILTDSAWQYVEIFLKRNCKEPNAVFYWQQAKNFYEATKLLDTVAKPLTSYYCLLNATKALLEAKSIGYDVYHGVSGGTSIGYKRLKNEYVRLHVRGVLSGLCQYMKEPVRPPAPIAPATRVNYEEFTLKDVFYNLPFLHRAYHSTFKNQAELFIPILNPRIVRDQYLGKCWLEITLEPEHSTPKTLKRMVGYSLDNYYDNQNSYTLRRNKKFDWVAPRNKPDDPSEARLEKYLSNRRKELEYIYSPNDLWYVKRKDLTPASIIQRSPLTLSFAAMHRLSELARYDPYSLKSLLEKDSSWLTIEFIEKSVVQFIDQICCEITGNEFRMTGFRS